MELQTAYQRLAGESNARQSGQIRTGGMMRPIRLILTGIVAILALACGGTVTPVTQGASSTPSGAPSASPATSPTAAATLLLKVTTEGGFINPAANLNALPSVAVYSDGRILTPGAVDAMFPGPLVMPVAVHDVGPDGAAAILAAIKRVGLDKPATGDGGIAADSGTNVFTVVVDGAATTSRFARGGRPGQPGGPVASGDEERAAALALLDRLLDPSESWGVPAATPGTYPPPGYRVFVAPGAPISGDPSVTRPPIAWPLPTTLAGFGTPANPDRGIAGLRQGVLLADDATRMAPLLEQATAITAFTSGGSLYTLSVRALYPDELGG